MNAGVSVIICCHNSAKRLPETLAHLAAQAVPAEIPWEVIVIDNASTDDTAATALRCWPASPPAPIRVASEPEAGLSHARVRGIREARYPIISFIDDDNWTPPDWVKQANATFEAHPQIGAAGTRIEAVCETSAPAWFAQLAGNYAVGPQHLQSGDVTDSPGTLLCGAGLSLRTEAAQRLLEDGFTFRMTGRKKDRLLTGEDSELCFALRASGWRFWYDDHLVLRHFIPRERLEWSYAVRLMRGVGESSALFALYLGALNAPPYQDYPMWKRTWLFQFLKAAQQLCTFVLTHPMSWFQSPNNSLSSLECEKFKSRLAATWSLHGRYRQLQQDIRNSKWVRTGTPG